MKIKSNKGFVGIDMVLSILAIMIFSIIIVSMMYNNFLENLKINRQALAIVYLTETLENVGIATYEEVTQNNIDDGTINLFPSDIENTGYNINMVVENLELSEDIIKKVTATISYKLGNKTYEHSMERIKAK